MSDDHFKEEIPIQVDGFTEWWMIGLDVIDDQICQWISYGGITQDYVPLPVARHATTKWLEWLSTLPK